MSDTSTPTNTEIASLLEEFADRLEATGVEYKPTAYRRAADNIREQSQPVAELTPDQLQEIDRVGEAIATKINEYVETDSIEELEALRGEMPIDIAALTSVEDVGPKTAGKLYTELDVRTLTDLEQAAQENRIRDISGFGAKTEQNILENIQFAKEAQERELLGDARPIADELLDLFDAHDAVDECEVAGSIRRWRPTIGDVDILVGSDSPEDVVETFVDQANQVIESGSKKASIRYRGVRTDLRIVDADQFGSALQYFTGSKEHNVTLRNYALDQDISLNEYGAFDADKGTDSERLAGQTEESMYDILGLEWIPPELREDRGEIDAAAAGDLPDLITHADLRGDLHVHTDWSDGRRTIEEMITGAAEYGHEYIAITDHASGPGIVGSVGLSDSELRDQIERVHEVDADAPIDVLTGVETNITADGDLSTSDELLADLDIVVASPHSGLGGDGTDRLIAAMEHPDVDIIGHPSGRLINQRSGLSFDATALGEAAARTDTALEVNSNPARLDLWGEVIKEAIDTGAQIAINTDSHSIPEYEYLRFGVHTARRGWATADDIINTMPADSL